MPKRKIYIYLTIHILPDFLYHLLAVFADGMQMLAKTPQNEIVAILTPIFDFRFLRKYVIPLQNNHR